MTITTVVHECVNTRIYPTVPPTPLTGPVTVTAGGAPGDGTVVVTTQPPRPAPLPNVDTGTTSLPFDTTGVNEIWVHYIAPPHAPRTVEISLNSQSAI